MQTLCTSPGEAKGAERGYRSSYRCAKGKGVKNKSKAQPPVLVCQMDSLLIAARVSADCKIIRWVVVVYCVLQR